MMKTTTSRTLLFGLALVPGLISSAQMRNDGMARHARTSGPAATARRLAPPVTVAPTGTGVLRGGGYCAAGATGSADFDIDERIINVTFNTIDNSSPDVAPAPPSYSDFTGVSTTVNEGSSYTLTVTVGSAIGQGYNTDQVLAWIDLDQDQVFDHPAEQVFVSAIEASPTYGGIVTIPAGTAPGTTRMRIRLHDTHDGSQYINVFNDTPCGDASYGEIEDYTVEIAGGGAAPANDECAGAFGITPGSACVGTPGNMEGATQSMAPSTCSTFTSLTANDVWYSFVATEETTIIGVGGGGDADTGLDPIVEAFAGACGSLSSLGCMDTSLRAGVEGLTIATTPGATYYYRIYYWDYGTPQLIFDYATCVIGVPTGTGYCDAGADGTGLGLDERIINVNFAGIDNDSPDAAPTAPAYSDFTGVTGTVEQGMSYPIAIDVARAGANTSYSENQALAWIDWNQDLDFDDAGEQVFVSAIESTDIYTGTVDVPADASLGTTRMRIRLHDTHDGSQYTNNFNDTPCGLASYGEVEDYSIEVTGGGVTPPNDECADVTAVGLNVGSSIVFVGDNTGATDSEGFGAASVWHSFTTTECANITIDYCGTDPAFANAFINLFIGCPVSSFIAPTNFDNTLCGNENWTFLYNNVPAGTYYYAVLTEPGSVGAYTLNVSATACAPPDEYCEASAVDLFFEKISNVTFGDINNSSASNAGYEDFTAVSTDVVAGVTYTLSVSIADSIDTDQVLAWIDWDHSSTFDAGEIVFSSPTGVGPHVGDVTVPMTAVAGPTRMRVRLHDTYVGVDYFNYPNPTPCDTSSYGQVEDYTVDMIGIITGVQESNATVWNVFPNPSNGDFTITYPGASGRVVIDVLDLAGRTVHNEVFAASGDAKLPLGLAGRLAAGTYVLRLSTDQGSETQRITIK